MDHGKGSTRPATRNDMPYTRLSWQPESVTWRLYPSSVSNGTSARRTSCEPLRPKRRDCTSARKPSARWPLASGALGSKVEVMMNVPRPKARTAPLPESQNENALSANLQKILVGAT